MSNGITILGGPGKQSMSGASSKSLASAAPGMRAAARRIESMPNYEAKGSLDAINELGEMAKNVMGQTVEIAKKQQSIAEDKAVMSLEREFIEAKSDFDVEFNKRAGQSAIEYSSENDLYGKYSDIKARVDSADIREDKKARLSHTLQLRYIEHQSRTNAAVSRHQYDVELGSFEQHLNNMGDLHANGRSTMGVTTYPDFEAYRKQAIASESYGLVQSTIGDAKMEKVLRDGYASTMKRYFSDSYAIAMDNEDIPRLKQLKAQAHQLMAGGDVDSTMASSMLSNLDKSIEGVVTEGVVEETLVLGSSLSDRKDVGGLIAEADRLDGLVKDGTIKAKYVSKIIDGYRNEAKRIKSEDYADNIVRGYSAATTPEAFREISNRVREDIKAGRVDATSMSSLMSYGESMAKNVEAEYGDKKETGFSKRVIDAINTKNSDALGDLKSEIAEQIDIVSSNGDAAYDSKFLLSMYSQVSGAIVQVDNAKRTVRVGEAKTNMSRLSNDMKANVDSSRMSILSAVLTGKTDGGHVKTMSSTMNALSQYQDNLGVLQEHGEIISETERNKYISIVAENEISGMMTGSSEGGPISQAAIAHHRNKRRIHGVYDYLRERRGAVEAFFTERIGVTGKMNAEQQRYLNSAMESYDQYVDLVKTGVDQYGNPAEFSAGLTQFAGEGADEFDIQFEVYGSTRVMSSQQANSIKDTLNSESPNPAEFEEKLNMMRNSANETGRHVDVLRETGFIDSQITGRAAKRVLNLDSQSIRRLIDFKNGKTLVEAGFSEAQTRSYNNVMEAFTDGHPAVSHYYLGEGMFDPKAQQVAAASIALGSNVEIDRGWFSDVLEPGQELTFGGGLRVKGRNEIFRLQPRNTTLVFTTESGSSIGNIDISDIKGKAGKLALIEASGNPISSDGITRKVLASMIGDDGSFALFLRGAGLRSDVDDSGKPVIVDYKNDRIVPLDRVASGKLGKGEQEVVDRAITFAQSVVENIASDERFFTVDHPDKKDSLINVFYEEGKRPVYFGESIKKSDLGEVNARSRELTAPIVQSLEDDFFNTLEQAIDWLLPGSEPPPFGVDNTGSGRE